MTQKELLSQLNDLKNIRPQSNWLKSNREILLSQISNSGAGQLSYWQKLKLDLKSYSLVLSRPVIAMASLAAILMGTATYAHLAFNNTRPNDSLYIAKKISEKAKLSVVFNASDREKLEAQFAANHAEGITADLAEAKLRVETDEQLASYSENFKKELNVVRAKMAEIAKRNLKPVSETDANVNIDVSATSSLDELVSVADNGKDELGTQIDIKGEENNSSVIAKPTTSSTSASATSSVTASSSEPKGIAAELKADANLEQTIKTELILEAAQELFDSKNYQGALDKMKEVRELIK